jgi:hypothetical protein
MNSETEVPLVWTDRMHKRAGKAVTCGTCGAMYEDGAWAKLALSQRIEAAALCLLVRDWPKELCVEVRACGACSRLIAAMRGLE